MRILLVICDGMGDRPVHELDGKTPLEAAETPNMNRLAAEGQSGLLNVIAPGVAPGSDTAHLALLGYDPLVVYKGRGPFEAAGSGMKVERGDVAFRCNFGTVKDGVVVDRRAGRISKGTAELASVINGLEIEDIKVIFKEGVEHRGVLILRGPGLTADVSDVDPHEVGVGLLTAKALKPQGEKTARILNEFTRRAMELLGEHDVNKGREAAGLPPANAIMARGVGVAPDVPSFEVMNNGMKGAAVVGISMVEGVCRFAGLDIIDVEGATGGADTDLNAKVSATLDALAEHDFVLLHIKAPDVFGHDHDPEGKKAFIERIDKAIAPLIGLEGVVVCITADHSTPCSVGDHTSDPVPVLIWGKGLRRDQITSFGEHEAGKGSLGHIRGSELLRTLMGYAGKCKKFGA